jgi:hypothetical protein
MLLGKDYWIPEAIIKRNGPGRVTLAENAHPGQGESSALCTWSHEKAEKLKSPLPKPVSAFLRACARFDHSSGHQQHRNKQPVGQGGSKVGPGHSQPETRRPKAERNPQTEVRIDSHPGGADANRIRPCSEFGFRPAFGFRPSVFGFQGGRT